MKEDRRIRKSKNALKKALLLVMNKKPLSKISVSELCAFADLNRSTFYANYESCDALLTEIHKDFFSAMEKHAIIDTSLDKRSYQYREQLITGMVEYVEIHRDEVKILFTNNQNNLLERNMVRYFYEKLGYNQYRYQKDYPFIYHTMAFFTLLHQWVNDNFPCTAKEFANIILKHSIILTEENMK